VNAEGRQAPLLQVKSYAPFYNARARDEAYHLSPSQLS